MVKIKVSGKGKSDVTEMKAKGWRALIFRAPAPEEEMIVVDKNDVRFVVKTVSKDNERYTEVVKYISGFKKDTKQFCDCDCGINGTLSISEGKDSDSTYAFFRNEKLQRVIDDFKINRIIFPREGGVTFEKEVHFDTTKHSINECNKNLPPFHTDGNYETIKSTDRNVRKWRVSGATYIFEYVTRTLTIPQNYDIDKIAEILNSFTV